MEKLWTVVQFIDEETVEAVPSTWIINNKCYWPPLQIEKIVAAIKKHAEPNTCWPSYDIKTFRNNSYDNYGIAREKARKAEFTSELTSDADNDKVRKKKVIKKKFSSSSDESVEESTRLRTPPLMQESSKSTNRINAKSNKCQLQSANRLPDKDTDKQTKNLSNGFLGALNNNYNLQDEFIDEQLANVRNNETEQVYNKNVDIYFKEIIRQQSYFKTQLWQMADDLKDIKNKLQQVNQRPNVNQREETIFSSFQLPFNTVEDVEQLLEQFLNQQNNFETSIKEVSRVGGKNPYEFMKRNCTRLLTNELAEKYSWLGAKQKRKFCNLKLADLLIASGLESNFEYNKKILEEAIQKWLRRAKERLNAENKNK